jgi:hypothetical protein
MTLPPNWFSTKKLFAEILTLLPLTLLFLFLVPIQNLLAQHSDN